MLNIKIKYLQLKYWRIWLKMKKKYIKHSSDLKWNLFDSLF